MTRRVLVIVVMGIMYSLSIQAGNGPLNDGRTSGVPVYLDSLEFRVFFHQDDSNILPSYKSNYQELENVISVLGRHLADTNLVLQDITITAGASPEGTVEWNRTLSLNRATSVKKYLQSALNLPDDVFILQPIGEDWDSFRQMLEQYKGPRWQDIIKIIDDCPLLPDDTEGKALLERELRMKRLDNRVTWNWYLENYFPEVRRGNNKIAVRFLDKRKTEEMNRGLSSPPVSASDNDGPAGGPQSDTLSVLPPVVTYVPQQNVPEEIRQEGPEKGEAPEVDGVRHDRKREADTLSSEKNGKYQFAVKTNLLFDVVACPNIELEFPIGRHFSVLVDHNFPWYLFSFRGENFAYEFLHSGLEARYWPGRNHKPVLSGPFIGVYGSTGKYDFEMNSEGYQCRRFYSGGISGGYSLKIARNWRFEMSLAIGYAYLDMQYYEQIPISILVWREDRPRSWFGPTKAKMSISWLLPPSTDRKARKEEREQKQHKKAAEK